MSMEVVLASSNRGKLRELRGLLAGLPITLIPQSQLQIPAPDESALSFIENAILKARNAARHAGRPAIADDSGISVDALDGAPGIYSARYAGTGASDQQNLDKLLGDMAGVPDEARGCRFVCAMVFLKNALDPTPIVCEGVWAGRLLRAPRGTNGFGYDPIFYVPENACSSAELSPEEKNRLSHRGRALRLMVERLSIRLGL